MKLKHLLPILISLISLASFGQNLNHQFKEANHSAGVVSKDISLGGPKTITCEDTLKYPYTKEAVVGPNQLLILTSLIASDNQAISQTFELGGSSLDISAVQFLAANQGNTATVQVEVGIYNVDANNNPTTLIESGTVTISSLTDDYYTVTFSNPATVTADYAVVVEPITPSSVLFIGVNDTLPGQQHDEDLSRRKSNFYPSSSGNWVSVPVFTNNATYFPGGPDDYEPIVAPIVSYTIDPSFTTNAPQCVGDPVQFTTTSSPLDMLTSRFYSYRKFREYFNLAVSDSTFAYVPGDGSPVYWEQNPSHSYTAAANYSVSHFVFGGFWENCQDDITQVITIDPLDDATITYSGSQYCTDGTDPVPSINSSGTFSATPAGLSFVNTSTGEIDLGNTTPGTYDITFQTNGSCPNSNTVTVTVNDPATAGFSYGQASYCGDAGVATATLDAGATTGTFTSSTGLSINGFTGEVDPSNSTPGNYTVTNTVAGSGGCSVVTATQTIEIIAVDDASFTYPSSTLCLGVSTVTPTTNETGTFTATPAGLVFANAATGEIDMSASTANTYSIVFSTSGACPNSSTQSITLTTSPDATFNYSAAEFCAEVGTESPNFPSGASAGTFTATPTGLSLNSTSGDITLDASSAGTYTVTNTIAASGTCSQVTETSTVVINALPNVDGGANENVCEGTQVTLTATGADTYTWTGGITQGTAFTPTLGTTTYTVTGTDANNCVNTDDVIVEVDEEPVLSAGTDQEVCEGDAVTLTATTSVGTITWDNGVTDGTAFTPTSTMTYTATATNGTCSVTGDVIVTVNPLPSVTVGADETTCVDYDPITLTGTPAGGTFSGTGVTGSEFDPNTAGVGTHVVTYTYQDGNGCENSTTQTFTVEGCASIEENVLNAIVIAPNPATSHVDIKINSNDLKSVQLVSAIGQVMNATVVIETNQTRVDLDNVSKGTYFLQINTVNGQTTKKLIVQ
jgi:hypothetical protein